MKPQKKGTDSVPFFDASTFLLQASLDTKQGCVQMLHKQAVQFRVDTFNDSS